MQAVAFEALLMIKSLALARRFRRYCPEIPANAGDFRDSIPWNEVSPCVSP
jgi:hypothetical protein